MKHSMQKMIINFTPTGMIPTREMTPHVPLTPQEIASDILLCAELGASMVHIHARDKDGSNTYKRSLPGYNHQS